LAAPSTRSSACSPASHNSRTSAMHPLSRSHHTREAPPRQAALLCPDLGPGVRRIKHPRGEEARAPCDAFRTPGARAARGQWPRKPITGTRNEHSPYLDQPLVPLAAALPRMLEKIEAGLAHNKLDAAEQEPLRRRAELIRSRLTPIPSPNPARSRPGPSSWPYRRRFRLELAAPSRCLLRSCAADEDAPGVWDPKARAGPWRGQNSILKRVNGSRSNPQRAPRRRRGEGENALPPLTPR
jgi:hypothetical protein